MIPFFGRLAFSYRPVIIAYLHLVMLCFVSFFIVGFLMRVGLFRPRRWSGRIGLAIWMTGVIGNELLLLIQSLLALSGVAWREGPYYLFGAALIIGLGVSMIFPWRFNKNLV